MYKKHLFLLLFGTVFLSGDLTAQNNKETTGSTLSLDGLEFRELGPAITSGRIADFAVNPENPKEYYVATAAGGVWKTANAGTTYTPIFDNEGSYSIGCITLDPHNSNVVWVGTGENNNQRSVSYGDGIYKSVDGGNSWTHSGLKNSEHIGSIIVHPDNPDIVYVAAIGPLWSSGGDRGVYKTTDGGKTWNAVLTIDEHTGINEVHMDPRNPDILYATAFQRRRHVFTYLGGGPQSAIYKSIDGGASWNKVNKGLPSVDLGRIGLVISPANPEIIYAIVEAAKGEGGFYKSTNGGASWEKQSSYSSSGNYYQELIADPIDENTVYSMNVWMQVSHDGGKSFSNVGEDFKHVDNHCLWIDPTDTAHLLAGCDGGIYETFDKGASWQFKANLPVTQFYKVAVDNSEPFYFIYGGTQDNFSMGGPSRTISGNGIANSEWFMTHGGDGFESAIDPDDPNIVYAQSQYGVLVRYDKRSGEELGIQPMPREGENAYRWNWDAPLETSAHVPGRIYFAANKVFRSDDRGQSWEVISDDLTRQLNRNELKVMDKIWSIDAVMKNGSTSPYGTIVAFSESPLDQNLLYAGTDDGLIQVTENGGNSWRKIENIKGVPERTYVNEVLASKHDANVLYAAFNHHKYGDFKPYIYKSTDKGKSWKNIGNDLPERGSVYAIEEDHVDPDLLFAGTEFGVFYSHNGGENWSRLKSGLPVIAVRDIAIQQRENDLVLGTFGRGFYVLDDYTPLRNVKEAKTQDAVLFPVRDAYAFEYSYPLGLPKKSFQGDDYYLGENLGAEAMITYFLKEDLQSKKDQRQEREKAGDDHPYPNYDTLKAEKEETEPYLLFTITDAEGKVIRKLTSSGKKGVHRLHWNLRHPSPEPVRLSGASFYNPFSGPEDGTLVTPGTYTVTMSKFQNGVFTSLSEPVSFEVRSIDNRVMPATDNKELAEFKNEVAEFSRVFMGAGNSMEEVSEELKYIKEAITRAPASQEALMAQYLQIKANLNELNTTMYGDRVASQLDMDQPMSIARRIEMIQWESYASTSTPTETHKMSLAIARKKFEPVRTRLRELINEDLDTLQKQLEEAGAPYTPNRVVTHGF